MVELEEAFINDAPIPEDVKAQLHTVKTIDEYAKIASAALNFDYLDSFGYDVFLSDGRNFFDVAWEIYPDDIINGATFLWEDEFAPIRALPCTVEVKENATSTNKYDYQLEVIFTLTEDPAGVTDLIASCCEDGAARHGFELFDADDDTPVEECVKTPVTEDLKNPRSFDEIESARAAIQAKQAKLAIDLAKLDAEAAARAAQEAAARVEATKTVGADVAAAVEEPVVDETIADKVAEVEATVEETIGEPVVETPAVSEEEVVEESVKVCECCGKPVTECACKDGKCDCKKTKHNLKECDKKALADDIASIGECFAEDLEESYGGSCEYEITLHATNIKWADTQDISGESVNLPKETDVDVIVFYEYDGPSDTIVDDYDAVKATTIDTLSELYGYTCLDCDIDYDEGQVYEDIVADAAADAADRAWDARFDF